MSIEPLLVGAILAGILVLTFIIAGVVVYVGKNRQKRKDNSSLPSGADASFNQQPTHNNAPGSYDDMEKYLD